MSGTGISSTTLTFSHLMVHLHILEFLQIQHIPTDSAGTYDIGVQFVKRSFAIDI